MRPDLREFDCEDCGHHVVAYRCDVRLKGALALACGICLWIRLRKFSPREEQEVRQRIGVEKVGLVQIWAQPATDIS